MGGTDRDEPVVHGVNGPIAAAKLGSTSVHEHLLIDLRAAGYLISSEGPEPTSLRVAEAAAFAHANPLALADNLTLDDPATAADELAAWRAAGGSTIVELTPADVGRAPVELRAVAERSGVQVVMGTGHYRSPAHESWVAAAHRDELVARIIEDLLVGVGVIRAGVIGEMGTSASLTDSERKTLDAAAVAQGRSGRALFLHVDPWAGLPNALVDICDAAGADPARIVLCHLDGRLPQPGHRQLARRGVWVAYDMFGDDNDEYAGRRLASDDARVDAVFRAFDEGWADHLVLGQDVALKTRLATYG
jgi:phosphotriesterase-related protein